MGFEAAALAMSAIGSVMSMSAASEQAQMQAQIAHDQAQAQVNEFARQQGDVNTKANEQKSDRMRQAEKELASARVASAEGFSMGTGSANDSLPQVRRSPSGGSHATSQETTQAPPNDQPVTTHDHRRSQPLRWLFAFLHPK